MTKKVGVSHSSDNELNDYYFSKINSAFQTVRECVRGFI